jgi:hypothetical protein
VGGSSVLCGIRIPPAPENPFGASEHDVQPQLLAIEPPPSKPIQALRSAAGRIGLLLEFLKRDPAALPLRLDGPLP